ncbi:hypothetical protein Pmani_025272 [Petrolisthes manimaculis]|uniref:BCD1 alpha/beta domain-containing protein n=1 Tax=Petrolisthes manimaculis TaxID=1843537 RepID=A0AAE1TYJ4_9EUCA|nr:hypothetical protein Pmani_025272 [Petrolisthes manimaculis]
MIPKEDMDNLTLLSDYRFLEEIDHKLETNLRNPLRRHTIQHRLEKPKLPFYLHRLKNEAWRRGTTLRYLPRHFSTSRNNSTRFLYKESLIRWQVQLIFHQADVTLTAHSVSEKLTVNKLLAHYLDPNSDLPDDIKEKLAHYHSASFGGVSALMKTDVQGEGMVFQELFPHKSLQLNFANKTVIEHPILYVVLKHHVVAYLEYQSIGHDDIFQDSEVGKEISKCNGLSYFDADSDCDREEQEVD